MICCHLLATAALAALTLVASAARAEDKTPIGITADTPWVVAADEPEAGQRALADDHPIVRQGLAGLLEQQAELELVGQARDGLEAVEIATQIHPDVILMDITMPRLDGIEATRRIKAELPDVCVIGLSMHEGEDLPLRTGRVMHNRAIGMANQTTPIVGIRSAARINQSHLNRAAYGMGRIMDGPIRPRSESSTRPSRL